jgi:predicted TPR repeat methyltransferase
LYGAAGAIQVKDLKKMSRLAKWIDNMKEGNSTLTFVDRFVHRFQNLAQTNYELGIAHVEKGNVTDAIWRFKFCLWLSPRHYLASYNLGCCLLKKGKIAEAKNAFLYTLQLAPEYEEARYMLATVDPRALPPSQLPHSMPLSLVYGHFETLAPTYNDGQVIVGYEGHSRLFQLVKKYLEQGRVNYSVLDMGCGTGLCGPLFRSVSDTITGVDISPSMLFFALEQRDANGRRIYDTLVEKEIRAYLFDLEQPQFDMAVASNVFNYIGELNPVFEGCARAVLPGGLLAFSTEKASADGYQLIPGIGRFAHSENYVRDRGERHRFTLLEAESIPMYRDYTAVQYIFRKNGG